MQAELKRAAGRAADDVKWVPIENVHLTLQFLGGVPEERVEDVGAAVAAAARTIPALHLELQGTGAFPSARRARVLWAGIGGDLEGLTALVAELGRRLSPLGFPPEARAFSAHLTLGRSRDPRGLPGLAAALAHVADTGSPRWRATDVVLFQSRLSPAGPIYQALARAPLGAG